MFICIVQHFLIFKKSSEHCSECSVCLILAHPFHLDESICSFGGGGGGGVVDVILH